ncbi:AMP-binding protein [Streptomyces vietnamensis]|uniref:AMP-binding protein n=1 Tax=Streptomyces vietnamensis TaxID=362257 RepID=UPI0037BBAEFE
MPHTLDYPSVGVDALLAGGAHAYGDTTAVVDGDESVGFAELYDRALRVAGGLRARGVRPCDTAALHMTNSPSFVAAYYGALCAGAVVASINPDQPEAALRQQPADVTAKAVVTSPVGAATAVAAAGPEVAFVVCVPPSATSPQTAELPDGVLEPSEFLAHEPLTG